MANNPFNDLVQEIRFAGENGFQGFELMFEYPTTPETVMARRKEILDVFSTYNLLKLAHTQSLVDISSVYELVREASVKETIKAFETAHKLEIKFLTIHPGYQWPTISREESLKKSYKTFKTLLKFAEEFDLTLGAENLPIRGFTKVEDFKELFNLFPSERLKFVLDVSHAHLQNPRLPLDFLNNFYEKLGHVHLSDNSGDRDNHLPLGAGVVDYVSVVKELKKRRYKETITLEIFSKDRDYLLLSKKKVENLFQNF